MTTRVRTCARVRKLSLLHAYAHSKRIGTAFLWGMRRVLFCGACDARGGRSARPDLQLGDCLPSRLVVEGLPWGLACFQLKQDGALLSCFCPVLHPARRISPPTWPAWIAAPHSSSSSSSRRCLLARQRRLAAPLCRAVQVACLLSRTERTCLMATSSTCSTRILFDLKVFT